MTTNTLEAINLRTLPRESVSMHDLREGDVLKYYGVFFRLRDRKNWGMREGDDPTTQGDCITFKTDVLDDADNHGFIPQSWLADWTFQGNKLARFARVLEGVAA